MTDMWVSVLVCVCVCKILTKTWGIKIYLTAEITHTHTLAIQHQITGLKGNMKQTWSTLAFEESYMFCRVGSIWMPPSKNVGIHSLHLKTCVCMVPFTGKKCWKLMWPAIHFLFQFHIHTHTHHHHIYLHWQVYRCVCVWVYVNIIIFITQILWFLVKRYFLLF